MRLLPVLILGLSGLPEYAAFVTNALPGNGGGGNGITSLAASNEIDLQELKTELLQYMEKRKEVGADEAAQSEVGKVIGGTKGNAVLDFVSGAPNKESVVEKAPDAFDYSELTRYGYGHLVTPIMKAGGRFAMYKLLDIDAPETSSAIKRVSSPELVIDRTGESDPQRYSGLKLGQIMDDELQAEALQNALNKKTEETDRLQATATETDYEIPFSDKRNIGPKQTPDWTPERLDDWGKSQGRVEAWARRAKAGEFVSDPNESYDLTLQQRAFSILTALLVTTAFGKSTDSFLVDLTKLLPSQEAATSLKEVLQAPALGLLIASLGSMVVANMFAKEKNRDATIWTVKGLLGGPFTVGLLRSLESLITRAEEEERAKQQ